MHQLRQLPLDIIPEPTPIAVNDMTIVDRVSLDDPRFIRDSLRSGIVALLNSSGHQLTSKVQQQDSSNSTVPIPNLSLNEESLCVSQGSTCKSHSEKWSQRYQDLVEFRAKHGHCLVPLDWPENPSLAHWVKHQRGRHKMKHSGMHSTLSDSREKALEHLGFVWDSHRATWEERFHELVRFKAVHGHTNLPSKYDANPRLSTWVKCQRRQYKLFMHGRKSHMTLERMVRLSSVGFVWYPRKIAKKTMRLSHIYHSKIGTFDISSSCARYTPS